MLYPMCCGGGGGNIFPGGSGKIRSDDLMIKNNFIDNDHAYVTAIANAIAVPKARGIDPL